MKITEEPFASLVHDVDANADRLLLPHLRSKSCPFVTTIPLSTCLRFQVVLLTPLCLVMSAQLSTWAASTGVSVEKTVEHIKQVTLRLTLTFKVGFAFLCGKNRFSSWCWLSRAQSRMGTTIRALPLFRRFVCGGMILSLYEESTILFTHCPFKPAPEDEANGVHGDDERIERNACMLRASAFLCPLLNVPNNLLSRNLR